MRVLLDTHTLFWSIDDPAKISAPAMVVLQDPANDRLVSAATIWELAIKYGAGKIKLSVPYRQWMAKAFADLVLDLLPVTVDYCECVAGLPMHHRDPFDRLIIAQSLVDKIAVVGNDAVFDSYGVTRIW